MNARPALRPETEPVLLFHYEHVRAQSMRLVAPLGPEDCCVQSMPDASPAKWHLAHTTWFFETFVLERFETGFRPHHPAFRILFNSYYNGIGDRHARAQRGLLTRPSFAEVLAYRADVDRRVVALLRERPAVDRDNAAAPALQTLVALGLQHEQQHQELILADVLHLLSMNPLNPAYDPGFSGGTDGGRARPGWLAFDAGVVAIGHHGRDFCFDNESPRHRVFVEPYAIALHLVTNGDYRAFIEGGGYENPVHWLSEGWDWVCGNRLACPLYWTLDDTGAWQEFGMRGQAPLDTDAALVHVSYYEADAYARWAGARLPTEAEWEHAVASGDGATALSQVADTCWQWTASSHAPYPGYAPAPGALGEYNGKFMSNQYVLRGGSSATPAGHARSTYRNFFPASARWQFSGIRLARSLPSAG